MKIPVPGAVVRTTLQEIQYGVRLDTDSVIPFRFEDAARAYADTYKGRLVRRFVTIWEPAPEENS